MYLLEWDLLVVVCRSSCHWPFRTEWTVITGPKCTDLWSILHDVALSISYNVASSWIRTWGYKKLKRISKQNWCILVFFAAY